MAPSTSQPPLLALRHVTVMRGERAALLDVTLRVEAGEHVCILGPNGCGKSTLIKPSRGLLSAGERGILNLDPRPGALEHF